MQGKQTSFIAKKLEEFYFGGNWTAVNLRDTLSGIDWRDAIEEVKPFHTIAELVYHMNYFVHVVNRVLQGHPLDGNDALSFDCPPIRSPEDWENLQQKSWDDVRTFSKLVAALPDSRLDELLADKKYGSYQSNLFGVIEHCHYHLGQIVFLKKLIRN